MMRSLYSGVAGLKNHQVRMDVIGNNISNVNTTGFKKGRVTFQDIISQTMEGAAKPSDVKGGVNPKQVGLGMSIASIDTFMNQGSLQSTGKRTDIAIQGDGFFITKKGDETFYTRAGNFAVDSMKQLVNPANGLKIQGWNAITNIDGTRRIENSGPTEDIIIPINEKLPAKATSTASMVSNLNSEVPSVADPDSITDAERTAGSIRPADITIFDNQGNAHRLHLEFVKTGINTWRVKADVISDTVVSGSVRLDVGTPANLPPNVPQGQTTGIVTFNDQGAITSVSEFNATDPTFIADRMSDGDLSLNVIFNVNNGTSDPTTGNPLGYEQAVKVNLGTVGQYNGITQFSSEPTTKFQDQDGYTMGYLTGFSADQNGVITGTYSNGQTREIAQLALATFINPEGLEKVGDTNFKISNNSGIAQVGPAANQNRGILIAGTLEMSNVDLAEEFTDMIVTQRGFQASSRTISTSDEMLRELLGLKR